MKGLEMALVWMVALTILGFWYQKTNHGQIRHNLLKDYLQI